MTPIAKTCEIIEKTLGKSAAFRKVDKNLYVVHQGSTYVTIAVLDAGRASHEKPIVRVYARVVTNVGPEPSLFKQLMVLNARMRFGAFAYVPEGSIILFVHSILGGEHMDPKELLASVSDVAVVADGYDDLIVARYGGQRMQDLVEDAAMQHLLGESEDEIEIPWDIDKHVPKAHGHGPGSGPISGT
jgi:hypothetical protein